MDHKVILLFGGDSDERLVSVASAQAMAQAITPAKLWFWDKAGPIFAIDYGTLINHPSPFTNVLTPNSKPIFDSINDAINSPEADGHVFLLGLHGGRGENGYLQDLLDQKKRPYTGSNAAASKTAFNKLATKDTLKAYPFRMAPHVVIDPRGGQLKTTLAQFVNDHKACVVKPICGGSSIGCFFVRNEVDLEETLNKIHEHESEPFLVERLIVGRELTVGVVEGPDGPLGLPCTEIALEADRDFDYQGKYLGAGTREITPALLSETQTNDAQRMAVAAHTALSLTGYSRTDMILADDGLYYLETNTLPGLTKTSLLPQQLAAIGISMREFLLGQIGIALKNARSHNL